jgi:hypothetical protein
MPYTENVNYQWDFFMRWKTLPTNQLANIYCPLRFRCSSNFWMNASNFGRCSALKIARMRSRPCCRTSPSCGSSVFRMLFICDWTSAMTASTCLLCSGVRLTSDVSSCTFCARLAASDGGAAAFVTVYFWCANTYPAIPPMAAPSKKTNPTQRAALRVVEVSVIFTFLADSPGRRPPWPALPHYQTSIAECLPLSTVPIRYSNGRL